MARRKQSELGDVATRDRILESAKKHFLKSGFQAAPLRKIAEDAGFTSGALYGYFASKEELFYAITNPVAKAAMRKLDSIRAEMDTPPAEKRLLSMGRIYYPHIPEIVDIFLSDRDAVRLIAYGSKGTKYEHFVDNLVSRNITAINDAARKTKGRVHPLEREVMDTLVEGYIATLVRLIVSDKDRETIIKCMEAVGRVYENGIVALMRAGDTKKSSPAKSGRKPGNTRKPSPAKGGRK